MKAAPEIKWRDEPRDSNYPAAESYLTLIYPSDQVASFIAALRKAPITQFKAKDIFRASRLSLLGVSNERVEHDRRKIWKGKKLSPILLVRDAEHGKVVIADGYHRLCAIYGFNEDVWIPAKIA